LTISATLLAFLANGLASYAPTQSLAWLQWIAGLLDCLEDAALLSILFHGATDRTAEIARLCAIGKFALLG
jgi:hypothetical protein